MRNMTKQEFLTKNSFIPVIWVTYIHVFHQFILYKLMIYKLIVYNVSGTGVLLISTTNNISDVFMTL